MDGLSVAARLLGLQMHRSASYIDSDGLMSFMQHIAKGMLKRPFNGSWNDVESNKEVFEYILCKLPVRRVDVQIISKHWHSVLSTKLLILMMHKYYSKRNPKYFVYDAGDLGDDIVHEMHQMEHNGVYTESYAIPYFESIHDPLLIASFNGLICCKNDIRPFSHLQPEKSWWFLEANLDPTFWDSVFNQIPYL